VPLTQHARALADSQPDPRPVFDRVFEQLTSLFEIVAGVKEAIDLAAVFGPLFDLVEVAMVRDERVISLFVGPMRHTQLIDCSGFPSFAQEHFVLDEYPPILKPHRPVSITDEMPATKTRGDSARRLIGYENERVPGCAKPR
jgi:hypothetical protein